LHIQILEELYQDIWIFLNTPKYTQKNFISESYVVDHASYLSLIPRKKECLSLPPRYTRNAKQKAAWTFLDMYWMIPPNDPEFREKQREKQKFITAFKKQLTKSFYWEDLKKINSWH
jgi:hypothetical protein